LSIRRKYDQESRKTRGKNIKKTTIAGKVGKKTRSQENYDPVKGRARSKNSGKSRFLQKNTRKDSQKSRSSQENAGKSRFQREKAGKNNKD
jgi:hypothetical protein